MTKLKKFCLTTPLKVLLISMILSSILVFFLSKRIEGTRDGLASVAVGMIIVYNAICSVLSYSVLLNLYRRVRDNVALSFLSFYLPVLVALLGILIMYVVYVVHGGEFLMAMWLIYSIPFIIPQTYYFVRFRQRLKSGELTGDSYINPDFDEQNN